MLELRSLGRLELARDGTPLLPGRRKDLALLVYLARNPGRFVSRARLASWLWPVKDETRARRSVRQALTELRRALGEALLEREDSVAVVAGAIELDAARLEAAMDAGHYQQAVDLWVGEFLPGMEDGAGEDFRAWLEGEREALRRLIGLANEALADQAERRGAWDAGLAVTERWTEMLPLDERATLRHLQLLVLAGRRVEASRHRSRYVERLRRELNVEPSAEFLGATRSLGEEAVGVGAPSPGGPALLSPDLIAREQEFACLTELWERARQRASALALIEGEEGTGKSRLLGEFLRWLQQHTPQAPVLRARAFEAERDRPWVLARHLLAPLAAVPGVAAASPASLKALAALVPEVGEHFPNLPADVAADQLPDAVARVLSDAAAESPVVVAVDDVHLADPPSRELLEALCRRPVAGVFVLLCTLPKQFPGLADLGRRSGEAGEVVRLRVGSLSVEEVDRVVASMAEFLPADRRALAARLHAETGGNPLAVVEFLTSLANQGAIAPGPGGLWVIRAPGETSLPLPSSLREAIAARLRLLSPNATLLLQAAAVLGRESDIDLLRDLTGLDTPHLEESLDQVVRQRLLRLAADGATHLEFTHEAARRAVYDELPPFRRRELHRRAYRILRRRSGRDSTRQAALDHHRSRGGTVLVWWRHPRWVVAAAAVVLAVGATLLRPHQRETPASPAMVAVLPFTVQGSGRYSYLGEGMVHLLSADLDGLGGLRSADPHALFSLVSQEATATQGPARGRALAARLGAGLYVLGDIVEAGGRIRVAAHLYDAEGQLQTTAMATADSEADIYRTVDEIARQLLAGRRRGPAEELNRLALMTTSSVPALRAYLEGERRLREGSFAAAIEPLQAAVAADTTFALAYYRLAVAAEWAEQSGLSERAAEQAARFGTRLAGHHARLVTALHDWRKGDLVAADSQYGYLVTLYPENFEGWFQFGELLFHANPLRGHPIAEASDAWERVLALDPGNRFAVLHLARIAAAQDDSARLQRLVPPIPVLEPDADRRLLELAGWRALVLRNRAEEDRLSAVLRRSSRPVQANVLGQLVCYSRNLGGSERLTRHFLDRYPTDPDAHLILAHLDVARGRLRSAVGWLPPGEHPDSEPTGLTFGSFFASLPFVPVPKARLLQLRADLAAWTPWAGAVPPVNPGRTQLHHAALPELREYLLGTLSARSGDLSLAARHAGILERTHGLPIADTLARAMALGLRALVARGQGRPEDALRFLEHIKRPSRREEVSQSPFYGLALERYLRAELLRDLGRDEEALAWYGSLAELSPFDIVFLAPSHLHRAEIYERLGRHTEAAEHYARFVELWKDADPELQPAVAAAGARLAELRR